MTRQLNGRFAPPAMEANAALVVVDPNGRLIGLISIGDLNAHHLTSQEQTIHMMHDYLYGRT